MFHDTSRKRKKGDEVRVNADESKIVWNAYHEHAILRACVNEYTNFLSNRKILAERNGEMCSQYLQDHLNAKFKPFLIDCVKNLLLLGFVSFNVVPASRSKTKIPYPCVVDVSNANVTISLNSYGETILNSKLSDTDGGKIPIYYSEKPNMDGTLTSLVSTAKQYVQYSKFLYMNERENLQSREHPIFIVQEKEQKDIDPFQSMLHTTVDEDTSKIDDALEKLTSVLNANMRKNPYSNAQDERVSFVKCPPGANVTQVSTPESRLSDTIKMQDHLSMMICHAMQVPIDLLFHNLTHQTDAKILASRNTFERKIEIYEKHALAIAQKAFVLCFAKFEDFNEDDKQESGGTNLKIYFMIEEEEKSGTQTAMVQREERDQSKTVIKDT
jgi:hypothetical protein